MIHRPFLASEKCLSKLPAAMMMDQGKRPRFIPFPILLAEYDTMGFMKEFKEFAMRGNVVDMAVGVVIGGAFGAVVTTLVDNVMLPIIGAVTGKLGDLTLLQQSVTVPGFDPILIKYGMFLAAAVKFTITAFCLFLVVKAMNSMKRKNADAPPPPAPPTKDQELLAEIRDLLKQR